MLLLREGQTGEAWEPSKNSALSEIGDHPIEKCFQFSYLIRKWFPWLRL